MLDQEPGEPRRLLRKSSTLGSTDREEAFDAIDAVLGVDKAESNNGSDDQQLYVLDAMLSPSVPGIQVKPKNTEETSPTDTPSGERSKRLVITGAGPAIVRRDVPSLNRAKIGLSQIRLDLGLLQQVRDFSEPADVRARRDKFAYFDKQCSQILEHVFVGSDYVARNRSILAESSITHVLNCVGFVCPEYFPNEIGYKTLWLQDNTGEDITSVLYDVFDYIEDVRQGGGRVFVHCCQGVSRSTSLVIAYLMWQQEMEFEDAFRRVKAIRGVASPNMGFACQLLQWQKRVLHPKPLSQIEPSVTASKTGDSKPGSSGQHEDGLWASESSKTSEGSFAVPEVTASGDSFDLGQPEAVSLSAGNAEGDTSDTAQSRDGSSSRSMPYDSTACRMYRMASHSPYDALHLVPKIATFGDSSLDPRGAFLVQVGPTLYCWKGSECHSLMYQQAQRSAAQIIKYEKLNPQAVEVDEGKEPSELLRAFEMAAAAVAVKAAEEEETLRAVQRQGLTYLGQDHACKPGIEATDTKDHAANNPSSSPSSEPSAVELARSITPPGGEEVAAGASAAAGPADEVSEAGSLSGATTPETAAAPASKEKVGSKVEDSGLGSPAPGGFKPGRFIHDGSDRAADESKLDGAPQLHSKPRSQRHSSAGRRRKASKSSSSVPLPSSSSSSASSAPPIPVVSARHPSPLRLLGNALLGRRSLDKDKGEHVRRLTVEDTDRKVEWVGPPGSVPGGVIGKLPRDSSLSEEEGEGGHVMMAGCAGIMEKRSPKDAHRSKAKGSKGSFLTHPFLRSFSGRDKAKPLAMLPSIDTSEGIFPRDEADAGVSSAVVPVSPMDGLVSKEEGTEGVREAKSELPVKGQDSAGKVAGSTAAAAVVAAAGAGPPVKEPYRFTVSRRLEYDADFEYFLSAACGSSPRPIAGLGSPSTHKILPHEGRGWIGPMGRLSGTEGREKGGEASGKLQRYASAVGVMVAQVGDAGRDISVGVGLARPKGRTNSFSNISLPSPSSFSPRSLGMFPPSGAGAYGHELAEGVSVAPEGNSDGKSSGTSPLHSVGLSDGVSSGTDEDNALDPGLVAAVPDLEDEGVTDDDGVPGVRGARGVLSTPRGARKVPEAPWITEQRPPSTRAPLPAAGGRSRRRPPSGLPPAANRPIIPEPPTQASVRDASARLGLDGASGRSRDNEAGEVGGEEIGDTEDWQEDEHDEMNSRSRRASMTPRGMRSGTSMFSEGRERRRGAGDLSLPTS